MYDNLIQWNWENRSKGLNIIINDNKKISKMFGDRYLQFIHINQATQVNSKDDLINLLNSKPRSFLTGVQILVNKFKNYENKLIDNKKQNKGHFKNFIMLNKKNINHISKLPQKKLRSKINTTTLGAYKTTIKTQSQSQFYKFKSLFAFLHRSDLIKDKISQLKQDLNNNNLPIPLNFLKPLLQVNKDKENNFNLNSHDNYNLDNNKLVTGSISKEQEQEQQSFFGKENLELESLSNIQHLISKEAKEAQVVKEDKEVYNFRLEQIINKSQISIFKQILESGIKTNYTDEINHFKNLIHNYQKNTNININIKQYFNLVTPYKIVNKFNQNITYNFNKYNKINIDNIVTLLEYAFRAMSCLISKPVFMITANNIVINLFYYFIPGKVNKKTRKNRLNRLKKLDLFLKDQDKDKDKDKDTSLNVNVNVNLNVNETLNLSKNQANLETNTNIATEIGGISIVNNNNNNNNNNNQDNNTNTNTNNPKTTELSDKAKEQLLFKKYSLQFLFSPKNQIRLNKLCRILSKILNKTVVLDLIPLKLPFFDDNILVKAIGMMCNKIPVRTFFNFIFRRTVLYSKIQAHENYRYSVTRSFLAGIKVKIGGRLMTQKVIPRISSRVLQRGPTSPSKVTYVDWSRVNLKNRRGAHSITVTMSHII